MDRKTQAQVILIAVHATILVTKLDELITRHPDEIDEESVIAWSEVEQLVEEFKKKAYPQKD